LFPPKGGFSPPLNRKTRLRACIRHIDAHEGESCCRSLAPARVVKSAAKAPRQTLTDSIGNENEGFDGSQSHQFLRRRYPITSISSFSPAAVSLPAWPEWMTQQALWPAAGSWRRQEQGRGQLVRSAVCRVLLRVFEDLGPATVSP